MSANLKIEDSVHLEDLTCENIEQHIIEPANIIDLEEILLNEIGFDKIQKGQSISNEKGKLSEQFVKLMYNNILIGIGVVEEDLIKPKVVLN